MGGDGGGGGGGDSFQDNNDFTVSAFDDLGPQVTTESPFTESGISTSGIGGGSADAKEEGPQGAAAPVSDFSKLVGAFSTSNAKKGATAGSILGPVGTILGAVGGGLFDIGTQQMKDEGITGADLAASEAEADAQSASEEGGDNETKRPTARRAARVASSAADSIGAPIVQKEGSAVEEEEEKAKKRKGRASTRVTGRLGLQGPANTARNTITRLGRSR